MPCEVTQFRDAIKYPGGVSRPFYTKAIRLRILPSEVTPFGVTIKYIDGISRPSKLMR